MEKMSKKVSIIGCSIAGLGTALELLNLDESADVTLFDRKEEVGYPTICGGAISTFMLQEIKIRIPPSLIASVMNSVRIYSPNGSFWELKSRGKPYGYVLWRRDFETYLAQEILGKGGKFQLNSPISSLPKGIVVAADGLTGISRGILGLNLPKPEDIHIGVQQIAFLDHPEDRIDLFFGGRFALQGYCWIFPIGSNNHRIGLGIPLSQNKNPRKLLEDFTKFIGAKPLTRMKGKFIPTARPEHNLVFNNTLLVGDAGLLCDASTGGGIANAFLSGKYAAKAIFEGKLERYNDYCSKLKRRNEFRYKIKQILFNFSDEDFNDLIKAVEDFKPTLTRVSWAMAQAIIKLSISKPQLAVKHKVLRRIIRL